VLGARRLHGQAGAIYVALKLGLRDAYNEGGGSVFLCSISGMRLLLCAISRVYMVIYSFSVFGA
jgi:hypothetical protein